MALFNLITNAPYRYDLERADREIKGNLVDELNMFYGMPKNQIEDYFKKARKERELRIDMLSYIALINID